MEYTTIVVFVGLVLIWAVRKISPPQHTPRAPLLRKQERELGAFRLYVSIPILRSVELDPMLYIVIQEGRRQISILPTLGDALFPLPEAAVSEKVWKELEAIAKQNNGVQLHG